MGKEPSPENDWMSLMQVDLLGAGKGIWYSGFSGNNVRVLAE